MKIEIELGNYNTWITYYDNLTYHKLYGLNGYEIRLTEL